MDTLDRSYVVGTISLGLIYKELVKDKDEVVFTITLEELTDLAQKFFVTITSDETNENLFIVNIKRTAGGEFDAA